MNKTVKEQLERRLAQLYEQKNDGDIANNTCFSMSYVEGNSWDEALNDLDYIVTLSDKNPLAIYFYPSIENTVRPILHLRLYQWLQPVALSDILPILENFHLRTEYEHPYKVTLKEGVVVWINDFSLSYQNDASNMANVREIFQEAFFNVHQGLVENDGLNKLVLGASLSWYEITILRIYTRYLQQIGFRFSQAYIERALFNNLTLARDLIELFKARNDPDFVGKRDDVTAYMEQQIRVKLVSVSSLDEDRIINRFLDLIKATVRTTYFQQTDANGPKEYLAIKLHSIDVPELPLPKPLFEIFVYSPRFEAIHLRKERIARGGLRWSERREDLRTEILGLMKAQVVKNTVIVPSGAKGGFVLKSIPVGATREVLQGLVIQCYRLFISALLDLTDNINGDQYIRPVRVVCYDEIDPYLVVAADKGTATFSDTANELSKKYDFWLGDAFASGGSAGYDHKKMGITARGAWESIKRHFRELNYDVETDDFTVVGIGDMSGDVFGNGMLYSRHIKLLAAFDHRHIFIDPHPDPEKSWVERERLFKLPTSSWDDYSAKLISKGGGVYKRSLKSISLTPEMKQIFNIEDSELSPNELICALLKAPVDLLFNGGVGTYVKASQETHLDAGDRINDYCRVNGGDLQCKVVGEGGNMGFTQRGRIEFAQIGGLIYTDFIDNSAGVDCSDHEVNLKILFGHNDDAGALTSQKRNKLLASLTEEVAHLVLNDNKAQALVLSVSAHSAKKNIGIHIDYIKDLEALGMLNRKVEFLPTEKELADRKSAGLGLTRPELAILLAYTKIYIKQEILKSTLPEDDYINQIVVSAFPDSIRQTYLKEMHDHRLKRDIVATQLGNKVVNQMGMIFVYRMQLETGASVDEIIRAYTIVCDSFEIDELQPVMNSIDLKIPMTRQFEILNNLRKLISLSTRWFLHRKYHNKNLQTVIEHFRTNINIIEYLIPELMSGVTKDYLQSLSEQFKNAGISNKIAQRIATFRAIYTSLNIIEVASSYNFDLEKTARVYFSGGERMNLVWFRDEIASDTREDYWHSLTRLTLRDKLDNLQQALTVAIINVDDREPDVSVLIKKWLAGNQRIISRWDELLAMLHRSPTIEYTMFFIAIHELLALIENAYE